jgi:predicted transcriptional regulator
MFRSEGSPKPTDAELGILRVLWRRGPSTVREVQSELSTDRRTGYTTVLKLLQIMTEKGLVEREDSLRAHVYRAAYSHEQTQQRMVGDLLERMFEGSAPRLVLHALASRPATAAELDEIRALLDSLQQPRDGDGGGVQ